MKTNKEMLKSGWRGAAAAVALSACLVNFTACNKYDLDVNDPEGWGASIYSYLAEDGHYTNTVRLIDDLGMREVLSKTGSKTMFVADDDAYARFYANNEWGVRSYEQLTTSQKKMLLMGSMINSSYQVDDLSSLEAPQGSSDPVDGQCMRRYSSQTMYDTISVVKTQDLPNMSPEDWRWNQTWKKFNDRSEIVLMRDETTPPMLHFIEAQMTNNKITNDDYNFLYNYTTDRQPGDASVNGIKITGSNIRCSNGFIHKMEDVIMPLDNMAEIVAKKPQTSIYNKLLERFCAPFALPKDVVEQYNLYYNKNVDSVFQKRFFSEKSQGGARLNYDDNGTIVQSLLKFDPEWNTYYEGVLGGNSALEKNMGFMLVPSNAAMETYWNEGPGKVLKEQYGSWDNVPMKVVVKLLNNNMLTSFIDNGVPSKFNSILNDANDPMGVKKESIDSVWLGCNGAVYLTNEVFSPTSFVSVLYPATVNQTMAVIDWAVTQWQYDVYLNSLNSYYSFFIPPNDALLKYIDPASFGREPQEMYLFHYDASLSNPVWAEIYEYDMETGETGELLREERDVNNLKSKLRDVLDNHIVVGNVEDGNTYYKTKGGQELKVLNASMGANGMTVEGSMQLNEGNGNRPLRVSQVYTQKNGKCYVLNDEPIQTTRKSVLDLLGEHDEMSEMRALLEGSGMIEQIHDKKYACVSNNLSVFNTYNYTVYVPTNESIKKLRENGLLPTWEDVELAEQEGRYGDKTRDSLAIEKFLRYHIQDGAIFVGAEPMAEEEYETALIGSNGKFARVRAKLSSSDLTIKTSLNDKTPRKVVKTPGLYNLMAREYQLEGTDLLTATRVYTTSTAVVHLIDGPLIYK